MTKASHTIVYIDGENFIHRALDALGSDKPANRNDLINLQVRQLIEQLLEIEGEKVEIRYYTTKLRLSESPTEVQAKLNQMAKFNSLFMPRLIQQKIQIIKAGILRIRNTDPCRQCGLSVPYFVEKGVDVRLSVDMVKDAHSKQVSQLVLVSSDLDILPAVEVVKDLGKRLVYIGYSAAVNLVLTSRADETHTFTTNHIKKAIKDAR